MVTIKLFGAFVFTAILLTSCGGNGGLGGPLTGPNDVHRGEADAINPARNVTVICEKDKNQNSTVTVNITNNCNKNNPVDASSESSSSTDDHSDHSSSTIPPTK